MKKSEYLPYLRTLRRVPDDVILSVATRDLDLDYSDKCICGWAVREAMGRMFDRSPDEITSVGFSPHDVPDRCADYFGGDGQEWRTIYLGTAGLGSAKPDHIERAFVERVMEAAS